MFPPQQDVSTSVVSHFFRISCLYIRAATCY